MAAQDLHGVLVEQEEAVIEWNLPLQEHLGAWGCVQARTGNYTGIVNSLILYNLLMHKLISRNHVSMFGL